jgi:hypothetical protein
LTTIYVGNIYEDTGVNITDLSQTSVEVIGEIDNSKPGTYVITYVVKDAFENETQIKRLVFVVNKEYEATFEIEDSITTIQVGDSLEDLKCTVNINSETFTCNVKENKVDINNEGIYAITFAYTYLNIEYTYKVYVFVYNQISNNLILYYKKEEEVGVQQ